ncbi:GSCFA domain-containing protein [Winogradskyella immobilis]|uniref:GSCFA domain-containing protein n=1 Tax=Winogradskyella immobilis TaxID=2816852 RepID=A0ABS8ELF1_9FLAO|nr:GSCFA domain-containing protein [Winogradskyella immobilis]MCC1484045.1 GSCFA domain-containing protein [Winogradskyella immobilis]MCG0016137.1 GSCFA domain-containing protein [Winogradskyella immobilis]
MELQTKISLQKQSHHQVDYNSKVLLLGSCFSENIGEKFNYYKFQAIINPFGILFHPLAIENLITRAINEDYYSEDEIKTNKDTFFSFDAHSKLNTVEAKSLVFNLNTTLSDTLIQIKEVSHIIITLGTSWTYRFIETDKIVANCHKIPQKQFLKELLSVEDITASLQAIISLVKTINPKITFIFTVSPVRHLKDGFTENTRSKAHLISAVHNVVSTREQLFYFPSYEIMMDELRDYRFYKTDMIHPNTTAIDYIWNCFITVWINDTTQKTRDIIQTIQKGLMHKPFNENSTQHQLFLKDLEIKIENLKANFPHISF